MLESNELFPSERLKQATDVIREALVSAQSSRQIAAIAPILVNHAGQLNLDKLHREFKELGLEYRLGWLIENILEAIKIEESSKIISREWRLKYRRAQIIIGSQVAGWFAYPGEPGNPPPYAVLDPEITSAQTFKEVSETLSPVAKRWRIITQIEVEDFVKALRAARGAD